MNINTYKLLAILKKIIASEESGAARDNPLELFNLIEEARAVIKEAEAEEV